MFRWIGENGQYFIIETSEYFRRICEQIFHVRMNEFGRKYRIQLERPN